MPNFPKSTNDNFYAVFKTIIQKYFDLSLFASCEVKVYSKSSLNL